MEVVQNQSGNMNFYKVKFDTGQVGYLKCRRQLSGDKNQGREIDFRSEEGKSQEDQCESIQGACLLKLWNW